MLPDLSQLHAGARVDEQFDPKPYDEQRFARIRWQPGSNQPAIFETDVKEALDACNSILDTLAEELERLKRMEEEPNNRVEDKFSDLLIEAWGAMKRLREQIGGVDDMRENTSMRAGPMAIMDMTHVQRAARYYRAKLSKVGTQIVNLLAKYEILRNTWTANSSSQGRSTPAPRPPPPPPPPLPC